MEEYRDTGWYDVTCTACGKFKRNGTDIKPKVWHGTIPTITVRLGTLRRSERRVNDLIARAWHHDYYDGCHIIPKDGNPMNTHIDNLEVVDETEFLKYRGAKIIEAKYPSIKDWSIYGVFKKTPVEGVDCTIDGVFRKNNRLLSLYHKSDILGRKSVLQIRVNVSGVRRTFTAARLVAQTWSPTEYSEDCVITYKDGNKHNIHSDNLILVNEKKYFHEKAVKWGEQRVVNFEKSFKRIEISAKETSIAYNYFKTGDLKELNDYVSNFLFNELYMYAAKQYNSRISVETMVSEAIGILYEYIVAYRPISLYTEFCKRLIRVYIKNGNFGLYERIPNQIVRDNFKQLNLESLCNKYREMEIK